MLLLLFISLAFGCITTILFHLEANNREAMSMQIPRVRLLVDYHSRVWKILQPYLWPLLDRLPLNWGTFGRYSRVAWHFADKGDSHRRFGSIWALVTPQDVYVHVADPAACADILSRFRRPNGHDRLRFHKPGTPCIATANWKDWSRYHRDGAAPMDETTIYFLWNEAVTQTHQLLDRWTTASETPSEAKQVQESDRSISSNALFITEIFRDDFATANTLSFATMLLAAHPSIQNWVAEELRTLPPIEDGQYADLFPTLKRCRAVMLETLRLYPPITSLPRRIDLSVWREPLLVGNQIVDIPGNTAVMPDMLAVHTDPNIWTNPLEWTPARWISTTAEGEQILYNPPRGTYFPWSDGPHLCPGAQFSQVEFVAVMASLLQDHRIKGVSLPGEEDGDMQKRVLGVVNDLDATLLLKMRDADRVKMVCERVEE